MTVSRDNGIMQSSHDIVVGQVIGYRVPMSLFLGLRWCLDWTSNTEPKTLENIARILQNLLVNMHLEMK